MKKRLVIEGMHCENCAKGLRDILLEDLEGVDILEISLEGKYADIEINSSISDEDLKNAVEELGFELKDIL
nr:heavy metal-associated domain-containing protein [uncultured Peptostreptococcus sp.]